jgi:predicted SPOUT superfamily RNA methylase MTH1
MCLNETYRQKSVKFPIKNGLKLGHILSPLFFNSASEYTISRVQENKEGLKLNGTHQLLAYAEDDNIVEENIDTTKETQKLY